MNDPTPLSPRSQPYTWPSSSLPQSLNCCHRDLQMTQDPLLLMSHKHFFFLEPKRYYPLHLDSVVVVVRSFRECLWCTKENHQKGLQTALQINIEQKSHKCNGTNHSKLTSLVQNILSKYARGLVLHRFFLGVK